MSAENHHIKSTEKGHRRKIKLGDETSLSQHALRTVEKFGLPYKGRNRAEQNKGKKFRRPFNGRAANR